MFSLFLKSLRLFFAAVVSLGVGTQASLFGAAAAAPAATATPRDTWPQLARDPDQDPLTGGKLRGAFVVFVVSTAATMLGESNAEREMLLRVPDERKIAAPKWQLALRTLDRLLEALPAESRFAIVLFNDKPTVMSLESSAGFSASDSAAMAGIRQQLRTVVPGGTANLECAFITVQALPRAADCIVLVTDELPSASDALRPGKVVDDDQKDRCFAAAVSHLRDDVPLNIVLLPSAADFRGPGRYWELASATRGALVCASSSSVVDRPATSAGPRPAGAKSFPVSFPRDSTHIALVLDTSGSMRDRRDALLWSGVAEKLDAILTANPGAKALQLLDADGKYLIGRSGPNGWLPNTEDTRRKIKTLVKTHRDESKSAVAPGICEALKRLHVPADQEMKMSVFFVGDEFTENPVPVLRELNALNPVGADGKRRITINAIGFPSTIITPFGMGRMGFKFADLMRTIVAQHGGTFVAWNDL